ncbi:MAG TPA: selenide, water dikinase SelD [Bacteroidia bacterium]|nr:selenide, water dikinase SelD [Bacteroidia bacterium]
MSETPTIRLTEFSSGSGCGCKIAPSVLEQILKSDEKIKYENLLIGHESRDDAAVYDLGNRTALISTVDFFTPIVDDAFDFGRIASANALSDVYAMGGKPALATAILGWPVDKLPPELATEVLNGARKVCADAGIPLAGGHSIDTQEPFFGLSVNGFLKIENLKPNNTAHEGDFLFLTKPLGSGIFSSAIKRKLISDEDYKTAIELMTSLNSIGTELGEMKSVHALTDITGFGLLGHMIEMVDGSNLSASINFPDVPIAQGAQKYISQMCFPDNTYRNWNAYEKKVEAKEGAWFIPLCDPQTNGGLLAAVAPEGVNDFIELMKKHGNFVSRKPIGKIIRCEKFAVRIEF